MYKNALKMFLMGTLFFFCSCIDDTYDLNKGISTDVAIKGNKIALPLGNLKAVVLDSLLDLSTISDIIGVDSATRTYSLALNDTLTTSVAQEDLDVLKEVSKLSSDIDPITVPLEEIKFNIPPFTHNDSISFDEVKLDDVSLDPIHEEIEIPLDEISLDPIKIDDQEYTVDFEVPNVEIKDIKIEERTQSTSFEIADIDIKNVQSEPIGTTVKIEVDKIDASQMTPPTFTSTQTTRLKDDDIENYLKDFNDNFAAPTDLTFDVNIDMTSDADVDIKFKYDLPKEIKDLKKVSFIDEKSEKGVLIEFKIANPPLVEGLHRTINFTIDFPENYRLALYQEEYYELEDEHIVSAIDLPADDDTTYVRFYLKEISNLDNAKYYHTEGDNRYIAIDEKTQATIRYRVEGPLNLPSGTTIKEIKDGLTYSISLNATFNVAEVYGSIYPIESNFNSQEIDFSFTLENLDYINTIDKVVLNPDESQLRFTANIDNAFGEFDLDQSCKIILSFPKEFVFEAEKIELPEGVTRKAGTNDFEISSVNVFNTPEEWVLPIIEVNINKQVEDGNLKFSSKAIVKAVSNGVDNILTIKGVDNQPLLASTNLLCQDRIITLAAPSVNLTIDDVLGTINSIGIPFDKQTFNFDLSIDNGLDYVKSIDYVEFNTDKPIRITSSACEFGNINFAEGNCIALRFPEMFEFDLSRSTLTYREDLNAFVIDDLTTIKEGEWHLAVKRINLGNHPIENNTLNVPCEVTLEAINGKEEKDSLYVQSGGRFSLKEMREQGIIGAENQQEISFAIEESMITIDEIKAQSDEIEVEFAGEKVEYKFAIDNLSHITHIGNIELKEGKNFLQFKTNISTNELGNLNLAPGSMIEFIFPKGFEFDPAASSIPQGVTFAEENTRLQLTNLEALSSAIDWKLAVKDILIDKDIQNQQFNETYAINVVGRNAKNEEGKLTIAALDELYLSDIQELGGKRQLIVSILESNIEIEDVEASIEDISLDFETKSFEFPVNVKGLELVKEIKYISFAQENNTIYLSIKLDKSIAPFELAESSFIRICFPKEFILDEGACDFDGLTYNKEKNAIDIENIRTLEDCNIKLVLDRIEINQTIQNNQFDWTGAITVTAINKATNEEGKLTIAGLTDLRLSDVSNAMGDKLVTFDVPKVNLRIEQAEIISNNVVAEINESIDIPIEETISEPIDRVDSIGFKEAVPMTLTVTVEGLEEVDAPVNLIADINFPPVFAISSNDEKIKVTDTGISINMSHKFSEDKNLSFSLMVNKLDFTSLENHYLRLEPTEDNKGRVLKYDGKATIDGSVSIDNALLSSNILNEGISLDVSFEMGEVVLKDFTGIYSGTIEPIKNIFELGIEDGFTELEKNGLTLTNTKPELMISLYNTIGVPVDVDLSLVGNDKDGKVIPTSIINPGTLHIKPAYFDNGMLTADTTRWLLTSDESRQEPGYEVIVVDNLDNLLEEIPYSIDFTLTPTIVTEGVVHHVDLSKLELGGSYSISVPFDLQFDQSFPLELDEEIHEIVNNENNKLTLANPQLALAIHNPIAQDLVFDLSLIGKDANDQPISTASLVFDEPFVLKAGTQNPDGTITPTATRWLFAVNDTIKKEGYDTKSAPALGTLLNELPHNIDIKLNAHFNTDLTTKIDYDNDLELMCEYGVFIPLQFDDLHFNYTDTISDIQLDLEEMIADMNLSIYNMGLALSMNLKNTLPLGLTLNLTPLDAEGNVIKGIEISSIELPAGNGSDIATSDAIDATPVEITIKCKSASDISLLDKISFSIDVASGNGNNALGGKQGLQISDIVLQVMCDVEMDLNQ